MVTGFPSKRSQTSAASRSESACGPQIGITRFLAAPFTETPEPDHLAGLTAAAVVVAAAGILALVQARAPGRLFALFGLLVALNGFVASLWLSPPCNLDDPDSITFERGPGGSFELTCAQRTDIWQLVVVSVLILVLQQHLPGDPAIAVAGDVREPDTASGCLIGVAWAVAGLGRADHVVATARLFEAVEDVYVDPEEHVYPMAIRGGAMSEMFLSKTERT